MFGQGRADDEAQRHQDESREDLEPGQLGGAPAEHAAVEDGGERQEARPQGADEQAQEHRSEDLPMTAHVGQRLAVVLEHSDDAGPQTVRRLRDGRDLPGDGVADRLLHGGGHQQGDQQTRQSDDDEDQLPAADHAEGNVDRLHVQEGRKHQEADQGGQGWTGDGADLQDGDRPGHPLAREEVRGDGIGGRPVHRLAGADDEARQEELGVVLRNAAERSADAPDRDRHGQQALAAHPVEEPGEGHPHDGVEKSERGPDHQAEGGVGQVQVRFDARSQVGDDVDVELGAAGRQDQDEHRVVGDPRRRPLARAGGLFLEGADLAHACGLDAHPGSSPSSSCAGTVVVSGAGSKVFAA